MSFFIVGSEEILAKGRSNLISGTPFSLHPKSQFERTETYDDCNLQGLFPDTTISAEVQSNTTRAEEKENSTCSIYDDPSTQPIHRVKIIDYIAAGNLWDFWLAEHPLYGKIVLKTVYTPDYPCCNPTLDDFVPYKKIINEAVKEEKFNIGSLKRLQGVVVPKYYGLYTSGKKDRYLAIMLEYCGWTFGSGYRNLIPEWKEKIYEAYKQLHLHGVSHDELDGRHILVDDKLNVRLVGFRRSMHYNIRDPEDVRGILEEAFCIRSKFGGEKGEQASLTNASPEYWAQLAEPDVFKAELDSGEANCGRMSPTLIKINMARGCRYDEDGREIKREWKDGSDSEWD